jgi:diaminohydroxyphosphoribosylaminopyrimidine deaminase/5-amino-6-(5-phosphoribosylamino)uracil reductase
VLVYATDRAPEASQKALEARGVTVVREGHERVPIAFILADLAAREVTSVLVEGGGETLGEFLRGGHGDKVHLFVAPRILGGRASRPAFGGEGPMSLDASTRLEDVQVRSAGDALVVEGYPVLV